MSGAISGNYTALANQASNSGVNFQNMVQSIRYAGNRPSIKLEAPALEKNQSTNAQEPRINKHAHHSIAIVSLLNRLKDAQEGHYRESVRTITQAWFDDNFDINEQSSIKPIQASLSATTNKQKKLFPDSPSAVNLRDLNLWTRIVFVPREDEKNFAVNLNCWIDDEWVTIVSYVCKNGQSTRYQQGKDNFVESMQVQLPYYVVKQMAEQDLARNWQTYLKDLSTNRLVTKH